MVTPRLPESLAALNAPGFGKILQREIEQLGLKHLPLQEALAHSSHALDSDIRAVIHSVENKGASLLVKAGIFYSGIVAGCSCADDPNPVDTQQEYCEIRLEIDTTDASAGIELIDE